MGWDPTGPYRILESHIRPQRNWKCGMVDVVQDCVNIAQYCKTKCCKKLLVVDLKSSFLVMHTHKKKAFCEAEIG